MNKLTAFFSILGSALVKAACKYVAEIHSCITSVFSLFIVVTTHYIKYFKKL